MFPPIPPICGCFVRETDSDRDGRVDCLDGCPLDPDKVDPGICGCGVPDNNTDSDSDGTPDCVDGCPLDPDKVDPGFCGCGIDECWAPMTSGTTAKLESVDFPENDNTGYVVGGAGTILKTIDGGVSWTALNSGVVLDLEAVDYPNDVTTGYVVGDAGRILRTMDGGQNWNALPSRSTERSTAIVQYSSGWNASISRSRSTISRSATDCTRPADSPRRTLLHSTGLRR